MKRIPYARPSLVAGLLAGLILTGCVTAPAEPPASLRAAQEAISNAERVEAAQYAAVELGSARTKLASAGAAVTEKKIILANQFADEARAEAELASAKTGAAKAIAVNDEMKRGTTTLVEEMKRGAGDK